MESLTLPRLLTEIEVAKALGFKPKTLRQARADGRPILPCVYTGTTGRAVRYHEAVVREYILSLR